MAYLKLVIANELKIIIFLHSQVNVLYRFLRNEKVWYY